MGGLGNQLFQIYFVLSYAIKNNLLHFVRFPKELPEWDKRNTYWNTIFKSISNITLDNKELSHIQIYNEGVFHYNEFNYIINNINFHGYFQSYKYFENYKKNIYKLMDVTNLKEECSNKYNDYISDLSIHFRIGDYIKHEGYHPILPLDYYKKALTYLFSKNIVINSITVFFEEENNEEIDIYITELKNHISFTIKNDSQIVNLKKINTNIPDWEQLLIMSCCKNNIIANSSFSWWAAYLNFNESKKVCYPSKWFGDKLSNHDLKDLFPISWSKINL